jgi:heat shock protein HslJ
MMWNSIWRNRVSIKSRSSLSARALLLGGMLDRCLSGLSARRLYLAIVWFTMAGVSAEELGLEGTWRLRSVGSSPLGSSSTHELPFFTITGVAVEGFDGCNHFFGSLDRPGAIAATRRACPDATIVLPLELNELGAHLRSARINGDVLTVPARGPYPASTYVRQAGSAGSLSTDVDPEDAASSP